MNFKNQNLDEARGAELVTFLFEEFMNLDFDGYYAMGQFEDQRPNRKLQFRHEFRFLVAWLVFGLERSREEFSSIPDLNNLLCKCYSSVLDSHTGDDPKLLEICYEDYDRSILIIYSVWRGVQTGFREIALAISERDFGPAPQYDEVYFLAPPYPMRPHPQLCRLPLAKTN